MIIDHVPSLPGMAKIQLTNNQNYCYSSFPEEFVVQTILVKSVEFHYLIFN